MKRKSYPSREYLHECFTYSDGKLYWKERPVSHFINQRIQRCFNSRYKDKEAGTIKQVVVYGELQYKCIIMVNRTRYYRSNVVWILFGNELTQDKDIDHININPYDDKIENLREGTRSENLGNMRLSSKNKLGFKAVYKSKNGKRFISKIAVNCKQIYLGTFSTPEEAHQAYYEAANRHKGEFANSG